MNQLNQYEANLGIQNMTAKKVCWNEVKLIMVVISVQFQRFFPSA